MRISNNKTKNNNVSQTKEVNSNNSATVQFMDQREENASISKIQELAQNNVIQKKEKRTGLPDNLKSGIENLSGYSMDDVKVHYNSNKPAQLQAHAFAQGNNIHLGTGQEKHLPHEAWHVVQQKQGRVKTTTQFKRGININDEPALEREADIMGEKALQMKSLSSTNTNIKTNSFSNQIIQPVWENTTLTDEFYRWDKPLSGLRWYCSKESDAMYFMVESPNEQNQDLIKYQGIIKSFDDWAETGFFQIDTGDNSIDDREPVEVDHRMDEKEFGPHVFRIVGHKFNDKTNRMEVRTAHYLRNKQADFETLTDAAFSKHKRERGDENLALQQPKNLGRYVYHLTTLKNLMLDPNTGNPRTSILHIGLDPNKGGKKGGACETCVVLDDIEMYEGSKKNSKSVVAVTTSPLNIKMYANQRVEHAEAEFAKGNMTLSDILIGESILLRFRLSKAHLAAMEIDPQHPKDDTVRLIRGIPILPEQLEALTSDGWHPLPEIGHELYHAFNEKVHESDRIFQIADDLDKLSPKKMHEAWNKLKGDKKAVRKIVLGSPTHFPNVYRHIFHRQRKNVGKSLASYAML